MSGPIASLVEIKEDASRKRFLLIKRHHLAITAPEGEDLWTEENAPKLARVEKLLEKLVKGKSYGAVLPFGYELKSVESTEEAEIPEGTEVSVINPET